MGLWFICYRRVFGCVLASVSFGGMTESLAIGSTVLFVAFIALYVALFAWLVRRFNSRYLSAKLDATSPFFMVLIRACARLDSDRFSMAITWLCAQ